MSTTHPSWRDHAACRGMDTNLFFPDQGQDVRPAKRVCAECPVITECRNDSWDEYHGVFGGLSEHDRQRGRRPLRVGLPRGPQRAPVKHGTFAGYLSHRRHGDEPCAQCRTANAAYKYADNRDRRTVMSHLVGDGYPQDSPTRLVS